MRLFLTASLTVLNLLIWAAQARAQDRRYDRPTFLGQRVDWCTTWGAQCGQRAADVFCNTRLRYRARDFRIQFDVGPTRLVGSYQICGFPGCDGFEYIVCTDPIPSRVVFANPSLGRRRLDVCLQFSVNCGAAPADEFCRRKGFGSVFFFQSDAEPSGVATQTIGSGQVCDPAVGQRCHGYQKIVCQ